MITEDLFRKVLMEPVLTRGADTLMAVSGYVTAGMADRHLKMLNDKGSKIDLNMIVGIPKRGDT